MNKNNLNLISVGELARLFSFNKSKIFWFLKLGLLKIVGEVGKMKLFRKDETIKSIKIIIKYQEKGLKLEDIKEKMRY